MFWFVLCSKLFGLEGSLRGDCTYIKWRFLEILKKINFLVPAKTLTKSKSKSPKQRRPKPLVIAGLSDVHLQREAIIF